MGDSDSLDNDNVCYMHVSLGYFIVRGDNAL